MVSVPILDSPDLVFDKPPSRGAVLKSLPALGGNDFSPFCIVKNILPGHDNDPLDEELQQLSDSLGMLYEQVKEIISIILSLALFLICRKVPR